MLLVLLLARLVLAAAAPAAAPAAAAASMPTASFAASAHAVRQGGKMRVTNYKLEGDMSASTLELTRIEVFTPAAQVGAGRGPGWAVRVSDTKHSYAWLSQGRHPFRQAA